MSKSRSDVNLFKALADETRLRILRLLELEELNVWELGVILELPQPTISRHLAILRNNALVADRRDGARVFYRTREPDSPFAGFKEYLASLSGDNHPDLARLEECLKQRAASTRMFADRKAAEWDELAKTLQQQPAQLFTLAGLSPQDLTVADLGTGTGLMLPFLAEFAKQVYAVDQSSAMLRRARLRCSRNRLENVSFVHSRLEELDRRRLPPCDGLLLHFVLHQVARPGNLLRSLKRFLRPRGRLAIVDRQKHDNQEISEKYGSLWHGFDYDQLAGWLENAGLRIVKWHSLGGDENNPDNLPVFVLIAQAEDCRTEAGEEGQSRT